MALSGYYRLVVWQSLLLLALCFVVSMYITVLGGTRNIEISKYRKIEILENYANE